MSTYNIIKLKNITPLHIGKGKEFYDSVFDDVLSDMLISALASVRANIKGKSDDLESFMDSFCLSSAFPFFKDEYYLPKPKGRIHLEIDEKYRKKLKKIKYVEKSLFERIYLKGESVKGDKLQLVGDLLTKKALSEDEVLSKKGEVERVAIPRDGGSDATPYFFEFKYYAPEAGLFCMTDAKGVLFEELLDLFAALGEQGIGSDKNVGCGHFEVEAGTIELADVESADKLLLSMFIPTREELSFIDMERSNYQLMLRGGYMAGSEAESGRQYLKKAVYMMESSSMLHCEQELKGRIVNLRNHFSSHDIYRSGKAFYIPIINKQQS